MKKQVVGYFVRCSTVWYAASSNPKDVESFQQGVNRAYRFDKRSDAVSWLEQRIETFSTMPSQYRITRIVRKSKSYGAEKKQK